MYIDTGAKITSTSKRYPTLYKTWQSSWGETPADAGDYYYLVWEVASSVQSTITQPYNLTFTDTITMADGYNKEGTDYVQDNTISKGLVEVVGFKMSGQSSYSPENTVTNSTLSNTRYDYVLTRHPKSSFESLDRYNIANRITVTLQPADMVDEPTEAVANKTFDWERPEFYPPAGRFIAYKHADSAYRSNRTTSLSELGMKAGQYTRYDLQEFQDGNVSYNTRRKTPDFSPGDIRRLR